MLIGVGALALALSLAACKSGTTNSAGTANPAGPASATAVAPSTPPAAPTATGVAGKHIDVCSVLSVAAVASATGRAYSTAKPKSFSKPTAGDACNYSGASDDDLLTLSVTVTYADADTIYRSWQTSSSTLGYHTTSVSGLGDKAFRDSDDLVVQFGSDVVAIQDLLTPPKTDPLTAAQMEQLMTVVHAAL
ncbi:MAG TPA: DUF3558 family protein [Micromonosporaceae bacterium]|jgi:hypothetical protein